VALSDRSPITPRPTSLYIGRFAPSPTGALHFGSLVAAVGSYLQARSKQGRWLLRVEDLDRPREVAGAADLIVRTLDELGFEWDGPIVKQSQRDALYERALGQLHTQQQVFACSCSRAAIAAVASPADEPRYPGTCRSGPRDGQPLAMRFRVEPETIAFEDAIQGHVAQDVAATVGDFVLKRRDGLFAYHLAVVVDDAEQGITEVVRGADLIDSTPRQLLLYRALGIAPPTYAHLPLAVDTAGRKLSKSSQSLPIDARDTRGLWHALDFLRQSPPQDLMHASLAELWRWAHAHWSLQPLRGIHSGVAPAANIS
jgi:glutamyl-Q tRNA(Asp) synthetase